MPQVQLVLGAGGLRCFAYIGAIQELGERGYKFSTLSGVSAGALIGVLVAAGLSGGEMNQRLLELDLSLLPHRKLHRRQAGNRTAGTQDQGSIDCQGLGVQLGRRRVVDAREESIPAGIPGEHPHEHKPEV